MSDRFSRIAAKVAGSIQQGWYEDHSVGAIVIWSALPGNDEFVSQKELDQMWDQVAGANMRLERKLGQSRLTVQKMSVMGGRKPVALVRTLLPDAVPSDMAGVKEGRP